MTDHTSVAILTQALAWHSVGFFRCLKTPALHHARVVLGAGCGHCSSSWPCLYRRFESPQQDTTAQLRGPCLATEWCQFTFLWVCLAFTGTRRCGHRRRCHSQAPPATHNGVSGGTTGGGHGHGHHQLPRQHP